MRKRQTISRHFNCFIVSLSERGEVFEDVSKGRIRKARKKSIKTEETGKVRKFQRSETIKKGLKVAVEKNEIEL